MGVDSQPTMPPHDQLAEMCLLGSMILNAEAIKTATDILTDDAFYLLNHKDIFQGICAVWQEHGTCDLPMLRAHLQQTQLLEKVGGVRYLSECMEAVPTSTNAEYYARIVEEQWCRRQVQTQARELLEATATDAVPIGELESSLLETVERLRTRSVGGIPPLANQITEAEAILERRASGNEWFADTGLPSLDRILRGIYPGAFVILGGLPSVGKTAFALHLVRRLAIDQAQPILFFSAEMRAWQLVINLVRVIAGVDYTDVGGGKFSGSIYEKWQGAVRQIRESRLLIDDTPAIYIEDVLARARRQKMVLYIVDYIQLLRTRQAGEFTLQIQHIAAELKRLAGETNTPVLALSQVTATEDGPMPKWARAIEEAADQYVLLLGSRTKGDDWTHDEQHKRKVMVKKNRNGPVGLIKLNFYGPYLRFEEIGDDDAGTRRDGAENGDAGIADHGRGAEAARGGGNLHGDSRLHSATSGGDRKGEWLMGGEDVREDLIPF